jgi:methylthioribose-1-phosphate isomerase
MNTHIHVDEAEKTLVLLDQRLLPGREEYFICRTAEDIVYCLKEMVVRGAPAIGVTAAWGCWLASRQTRDKESLARLLEKIRTARPTAVNLHWAVERMLKKPVEEWHEEAAAIQAEDIANNRALGRHGAALLNDGDTVMTHCNAGALATAGYGTALGVIRAAVESGKAIKVIANETRPFLQGSRLTAWEPQRDGIDVSIACDNACALLMQRGLVHKVVLGADRIAANGDTANKIGTYGVALLAAAHGIPFYVAAPLSTIDRAMPTGAGIPIETRPDAEVTHMGGSRISPEGVPVFNLAFDITPARLIHGIITEKGIHKPGEL